MIGLSKITSLPMIIGLLCATPSFGEQIIGRIMLKGNAKFATVQLVKPGEHKGPVVCKNEVASKIKRLSNMQIKITGDWKNKDTPKSCFEGTEFEVLTTPTGKPAVVGVISKTDSGYQLVALDGKTYGFKKLPGGLRGLVGKKVIVGMKQMTSPGSLTGGHKVVSYSAFPE
jgi:hypothetical protein